MQAAVLVPIHSIQLVGFEDYNISQLCTLVGTWLWKFGYRRDNYIDMNYPTHNSITEYILTTLELLFLDFLSF